MKTIVAPTDFSSHAHNAVNYAADMACVTGVNLLLVHVCPYPVALNEAQLAFSSMEESIADAEENMRVLKEELTLRTGGSIKIKTVVQQGDVMTGIKETCLYLNVYAVVMGREDMSAFERFLVGNRTVAAVKHLPWPVIAVPQGAHFNGIRNIGIACDFREVIETVPVAEIKSLVKELKANLHVLHVSPEAGESYSTTTIEESGWFQDLLGELHPHYHFIKGADPEPAIIEFADRQQLDLLIVIPKKHDLLSKLFRHSHAAQMVLHAHVPVMAMRG
jgi:nucleotide-binding universal stress UspA family protein